MNEQDKKIAVLRTFDELKTEFKLGMHLRCTTPENGIAYVYLADGLMRVLHNDEDDAEFPFWVDAWFDEPVWELCRVPDELMKEMEDR